MQTFWSHHAYYWFHWNVLSKLFWFGYRKSDCMCCISCSIFSLKQFSIWILLRFVIVCRFVHWTMVLCYVYIHYFILNIAPPNMISLYRAVSCRTEACSGGWNTMPHSAWWGRYHHVYRTTTTSKAQWLRDSSFFLVLSPEIKSSALTLSLWLFMLVNTSHPFDEIRLIHYLQLTCNLIWQEASNHH